MYRERPDFLCDWKVAAAEAEATADARIVARKADEPRVCCLRCLKTLIASSQCRPRFFLSVVLEFDDSAFAFAVTVQVGTTPFQAPKSSLKRICIFIAVALF